MVFEPMSGSTPNLNPSVGMSKVFMLDKYFSELQKFWDTEKRLQGGTVSLFYYLNFFFTWILLLKHLAHFVIFLILCT